MRILVFADFVKSWRSHSSWITDILFSRIRLVERLPCKKHLAGLEDVGFEARQLHELVRVDGIM